ncbi:MAG: desmoglein-4 [Subdoligranulum sp.]
MLVWSLPLYNTIELKVSFFYAKSRTCSFIVMNLRKSILALSVVAGIVAAPMTVFAAHTHSWGSPQYYGYEDEMPGIYDDWDKCATRHVYNYKQCLICGEVSIYEVETIEMSHKWVNGACVYCNKGYAKEIN